MNREIISEINRMREIMGLNLIVEATGGISSWAKKFFAEILLGTIDELPTQQLISRTVKSTIAQADDSDIQAIIQAIRRSDWDNDVLKYLDPKTLYKQLISTLPTNQALEVVRGSIRKIFKEEYPEFDALANSVDRSLKNLNAIAASNDPKTYNLLLAEFKKLKSKIEQSNLSKDFKSMVIDAYKLNQLPKSADEAEYNLDNLSKTKTFFSDLITKIVERDSRNINAPKKYKIGDIELDATEKDLLEEFAVSDVTLKELPLSLQRKMIQLMTTNDNFLSDYLDNVILSLGFKDIKGKADLNEFLKFYFKKAHQEGVDINTVIERELGGFDYDILNLKLNKVSESLRGLYELAYSNPNVNVKLWSVSIRNFLEAMLPQIKRVENFWPWVKNILPNWNGWKGDWDLQVELRNELKKLAQEIVENKPIDGRLGTIFNKVMLLKDSSFGDDFAKSFLDNELAGQGIFKGHPDFERIINSIEYKEIRRAIGEPMHNVLFAAIWSNIAPYLRMILLNRKWANVFNKSVPWVAQEGMTKGKLILEIFKESFLPAINLVLYADARTVTQLRQMDAYTGKYGKLIDKAVVAIGWHYYVIPWLRSIGERTFIEDKVVAYKEDYEQLKKHFCEIDPKTNTKIGTDDFCKQIDDALNQLSGIDSREEIMAAIQDEVGFIPDLTHVFEFNDALDKYIEILTSKGGTKAAWQEFKNGMQKRINDMEVETESRLSDFGYTGNTQQEKIQNATNNLMARVKEMEKNNPKYSEEDWKRWAENNGYVIDTDYIKDEGTFTAHKKATPNKIETIVYDGDSQIFKSSTN